MRVHFLGTGDAFCSGGRFQTCFLLEAGGLRALVDCGATSLLAMRRAGVDPDGLDVVILSHLHGDHFGGLPFLLLEATYAAGRTRPLTVLGPPGTQARVAQASEAFFPGSSTLQRPFPLHIEEMLPGGRRRFGGMEVYSAEVVHPSDAPSTALRIEAEGKVLAFSGDTEWTDVLTEVTRGADLFVCECYAPHGPVQHHLDAQTLLAKRGALGAKRILITHMGRDMLPTHPHPLLERAEDGMVVEL